MKKWMLRFLPILALSSQLQASQVRTEYYARRPFPRVAIEFTGSKNGLGNQSYSGGTGADFHTIPLMMQVDYQPLHWLGVWGIGSFFGFDLTRMAGADAPGARPSLHFGWSAGGQIRYQARYFEWQPVVPTFAYSMGSWNYKTTFGSPGSFPVQGPVYGLWVYLNALDRSSSSSFFEDIGVVRSYLTLEMREITGGDAVYKIGGRSYHVGLRFEI
jgi:hypothetical protein